MMSAARFAQIMSGMNTPAKKVYDVVPMEEAWTAHAICNEANKTRNVSFEVVRGCLDVLAKAGLVAQDGEKFRREEVRRRPRKVGLADLKEVIQEAAAPQPKEAEKAQPQEKETPVNKPTIQAPAAPKENVVDTLGHLAQRLAAMALRHQQEMRELADLVSDAAVEVQGQFEKNDADLANYHQLQVLLKGIRA